MMCESAVGADDTASSAARPFALLRHSPDQNPAKGQCRRYHRFSSHRLGERLSTMSSGSALRGLLVHSPAPSVFQQS